MSVIENAGETDNQGIVPPHPGANSWQRRGPMIVFAAGAFFFIAFTADTLMHGKLWQWDHALADFLKVHWTDPWNPIALWVCAAVTQAGDANWIGFFALVESFLLLRARRRRDILVLLLALLGSAILVPLMKALLHQPRPIVTSYFALTKGYNFPSGHTAGATIFFGITACLWGRLGSANRRRALWLAAAVCSLAVGASLIYIGAHYVTDVLAAWAFCAMWLSICVLLARRISPL